MLLQCHPDSARDDNSGQQPAWQCVLLEILDKAEHVQRPCGAVEAFWGALAVLEEHGRGPRGAPTDRTFSVKLMSLTFKAKVI